MKLLAILFCIAFTQANPINQYGSPEGESPWAFVARLQNANSNEYINLPSSEVGLSSTGNNFASSTISPDIFLNQQRNNLVGQSTPQPNFASSTISPDIFLNQQRNNFVGQSTPEPNFPSSTISPEIFLNQQRNNFVGQSTPQPNFPSSTISPDIFLNQQRINFVGQSSPQPNFPSSTISPDIFLNQQSFSSNPAPFHLENINQQEEYPRIQFQLDQNPVTIKAVTRGGYVDEAFGISSEANIEEKPEISKNFYFFAAPEEEESEVRPRIRYLQPNKKNVNVIFIKSPVQPPKHPIEVISPQTEQDKTVVYVLVKKPDLNQEIYVKAAEPVKPPKPDVFFLKYHNEDEAQEAVKRVKDEHEHEQSEENLQGRSNFPQVEINGLPEHFQNEVVNIGGNNLESDVTPSSILISSSETPFVSESNK